MVSPNLDRKKTLLFNTMMQVYLYFEVAQALLLNSVNERL